MSKLVYQNPTKCCYLEEKYLTLIPILSNILLTLLNLIVTMFSKVFLNEPACPRKKTRKYRF